MTKEHRIDSNETPTGYENEIKNLNSEIFRLRTELFRAKNELQELNNSRVLGKIIMLRNFIGTARHKIFQLPRTVIHHIRVIGAPFVPAPIRRYIKDQYKSLRTLAAERKIEVRTVDNELWKVDRPLVSIVVPYYNRHDTIDETLNSIDNQTFRNFEVIVIDDGSTVTESIEKLKSIKEGGFKAKFISQKNQGVALARNEGIKKAQGKYIICLDSDDLLRPTFIEKCTIVLESRPDMSFITTHMEVFGVVNEVHKNVDFDPLYLYVNNMVITAAEFRRNAWEVVGGYKSQIGYEDWEFWLNLSEHGFWGKLIPEAIFKYRTALSSRYTEDKDFHWNNLKLIRKLHPKYKTNVKKQIIRRQGIEMHVVPGTAFRNMLDPNLYKPLKNGKINILITVPWMTFGGAETLIYNYCREIKEDFNLSFITGLPSDNEWEYKFNEITPYIYHLANLFDDPGLRLEFVSNYIATRHIDVLHIIHNGFTFEMLEELRRRYPSLKVISTMFNDRVDYFEQSIGYAQYIDGFVTDNAKVANHYQERLPGKEVSIIPNGLNCYDEFNPGLYDREKEREKLKIADDELAIFFVGRLSVEKNPDVFLGVAKELLVNKKLTKLKFFLVGDGPMKNGVVHELKKIANDNIVYLGYQSDVAVFFAAADIFVLPSSVEGFPLSVLEAMAMKVVVVASDVGAVSEVVESGKQGLVVKPGSVKEISAAIEKLRREPALLNSMKTAARKKVEDSYSNLVLGSNYRSLYRRAAK